VRIDRGMKRRKIDDQYISRKAEIPNVLSTCDTIDREVKKNTSSLGCSTHYPSQLWNIMVTDELNVPVLGGITTSAKIHNLLQKTSSLLFNRNQPRNKCSSSGMHN
jgi:hypothetical protein